MKKMKMKRILKMESTNFKHGFVLCFLSLFKTTFFLSSGTTLKFQGTSCYLKEHYISLAITGGDKPLHACDPLCVNRQPANNSALACKQQCPSLQKVPSLQLVSPEALAAQLHVNLSRQRE